MKYYAVRKGYNPGIYTSWKECLGQVTGFKGATFKSFSTEADAQLFMAGEDPTLNPDSDIYVAKWYGVRSGKCPGVYTDWRSAQEQVVGFQKPKVKAFATREEAEAFVASGPGIPSSPIPEDRRTRARDSAAAASRREASTPVPQPVIANTPKKRKSVTQPILNVEALTEPMEADLSPETEFGGFDLPRRTADSGNGTENGIDVHRAKKTKSKSAMPKKSSILRIYTDGSSLNNGRDEATAGVGVWFGSNDKRNVSEPLSGPRQTNQRAELTAILRAIEIAPKHREVLIFSDSQYAINCVTLWHHTWSRNNWMTTLGKKVENQDLIEEILEKIQERDDIGAKTGFEWVKGHTGLADGNSEADRLAVEGAMKAKVVTNGNGYRR